MRKWIAALVLLLAPATAQAEWLEASSAHFVVYADDSERDVRKFRSSSSSITRRWRC